ncbi:MAG: SDR family NAD(P)-dependent oxidoreductase [Cardiobacteriaceae bacterium]|nr:SDR family NAD(P)-dependent oxidoreductase [Cardiobacteriaceae bacterium]
MTNQVWLITAATGGFGYELAKYALEKGDFVIATSRNLAKIEEKFARETDNFLPFELKFDSDMRQNFDKLIAATKNKFGRIDNLVNNAGYGLLGIVEEVAEKSLREQFEVNVFAPFFLTQSALKIMRPQAKKDGGSAEKIVARVFNLSSIGGFRTSGASTPYCMTKFAISAFSEGLNLDLNQFGIKAVNVMPTGFRTEFLGESLKADEGEIADYDELRKNTVEKFKEYNGKQPGNPATFAPVMFEISRLDNPPEYLFMGSSAFKNAEAKIEAVRKDMQNTREFAGEAMDFADNTGSAFDKPMGK